MKKQWGQEGRPQGREEWIYGINPVLEAVRSGRPIKSVYLLGSRREKGGEIERELSDRGIPVSRVDNVFFEQRFPKGHQGMAAVVAPRKYASLEELLLIPAAKKEQPLFLVLDLIEDPRNFGAILRVADAGGAHGVVIQSHRSATLTPEAVKASAGASEYMPVAMVANIKHAIKAMKDEGMTVIGAEAGSDKKPWQEDLNVPLAFVIGSEGRGLRRTVRDDCDIIASLPMKGRVNSLNASVATGILVFEAMRQRAGTRAL
ncbi:MAG: 23S rRNA (guanosine(2251)-2'-O)-methyltransferase RlmB [Nitrospirae bacterium]|nr:MAG: 23S rRNA (guanosine(2251)-2'-O)-methyltransferase RlmB [Nitrospirota bacterium]